MADVYDMIPPRAEVKEYLDGLCTRYNCTAFIDDDPVSVPHRFERPEDIEIAGFLAATIAWGQRPTIVRNARRMVELMDDAPWQFVMQSEAEDWDALRPFVHRTFNGDDFVYFVRALQRFYRSQGGLGGFFRAGYRQHRDLRPVLSDFRREFFAPELEPQPRTMRHLSSVDRGAACKRLNMFLKWMVRRDDRGVDFGLWGDAIPASALYLPLDVHTANTSRMLGLLSRRQNDWRAVEEVTAVLREFDPDDPVRYDYALFCAGIYKEL
ncbi:TIGR02757 family protein [Millionella massiliensis]|uniref:TIGR02757 family protein n=1 Tax=Millionella massiliensis TaxID=1871023 RepID=UPI000A515EC3|nr:TIGR02757 family protein [Millionella massiliensis]